LRFYTAVWSVTAVPSTSTASILALIDVSPDKLKFSVPSSLLVINTAYTFQLTFTNFQGDTLVKSATITRVPYPNYKLVTPNNAYYRSRQEIQVEFLAAISDCSDATIEWSQNPGPHQLPIANYLNNKMTKLTLPPFTTYPNMVYSFTVTTYYSSHRATSEKQYTITINTYPSELVAVIEGGNKLNFAFNPINLNGLLSRSLDEIDQTGLTYEWTCIQEDFNDQIPEPCVFGNDTAFGTITTPEVHIPDGLSSFYNYQIALTVKKGTSSATTNVNYKLEILSFEFVIFAVGYRDDQKIDPARDLMLSVKAMGAQDITDMRFDWQVTGVFSSTKRYTPLRFQNIKIFAGTMQYGKNYNVTLKLVDNHGESSSFWKIISTIPAPTTGTLSIVPHEGTAITTQFKLKVSSFSFNSIPTYTYGYYTSEADIGDMDKIRYLKQNSQSYEILATFPNIRTILNKVYVVVIATDADGNQAVSAPVLLKINPSVSAFTVSEAQKLYNSQLSNTVNLAHDEILTRIRNVISILPTSSTGSDQETTLKDNLVTSNTEKKENNFLELVALLDSSNGNKMIIEESTKLLLDLVKSDLSEFSRTTIINYYTRISSNKVLKAYYTKSSFVGIAHILSKVMYEQFTSQTSKYSIFMTNIPLEPE